MITSGMVSFEDGRKAAEEYAPARKVRVELSFSVDPNGDAMADLDMASGLAKAKVKELIFGTDTRNDAAVPKTEIAHAGQVDPPAAAVKKTKAAKAPKVEPLPAVDPFLGPSEVDAKPADTGTASAGQAQISEDVSDAALFKAVTTLNARINQPKKITEIIAKHCAQDGVPPSLKRVLPAKRVAFLAELKAFGETVK